MYLLLSDLKVTVTPAEKCGEVTTLLCEANPELKWDGSQNCSWSKDNTNIFENDKSNKYKIEVKFRNCSLMINNTDIWDNGKYHCSFGNKQSNYACLKSEYG